MTLLLTCADTASVPLIAAGLLGLSAWAGGLAAIFVVARSAAATLDRRARRLSPVR